MENFSVIIDVAITIVMVYFVSWIFSADPNDLAGWAAIGLLFGIKDELKKDFKKYHEG